MESAVSSMSSPAPGDPHSTTNVWSIPKPCKMTDKLMVKILNSSLNKKKTSLPVIHLHVGSGNQLVCVLSTWDEEFVVAHRIAHQIGENIHFKVGTIKCLDPEWSSSSSIIVPFVLINIARWTLLFEFVFFLV
jgi:hypothetical protein